MNSDRLNGEHDVLLCEQPATTTPAQQHAAAATTARHAHNADDLAALLAILGLAPQETRP